MENELKKGDVFQTSWGYDQTNYDFIIVEKVSPSGKTAICKRTEYKIDHEDTTMAHDALVPEAKSYGLPFRMKVERHEKGIWLRGSYPFLSRYEKDWDEEEKERWFSSKRLDTFSKVETGKKYYQTNPTFGH